MLLYKNKTLTDKRVIRIFITDDHYLIREGFKKAIDRESDMEVVGEAANANETLKMLLQLKCDVLVLDISLPGKSGLELIKDLEIRFPSVKILVMSIHPEDRYGIRVLKSSASGYISKDSSSNEIIKAIRMVSRGKRYTSSNMTDMILSSLGKDAKGELHENLSDREFEVLLCIGRGNSLSQISRNLSLSISTVNTYRKRILEKMGKATNAELIHYVIKNNLIE
ncbi:MAG: response regulator [Bacteroidales bacterium]